MGDDLPPVGPATPWEKLPVWLTLAEYQRVLRFKARRTVERHIELGKIPGMYVRGSGTGRRIHRDTLRPGEAATPDGREGSGTILLNLTHPTWR